MSLREKIFLPAVLGDIMTSTAIIMLMGSLGCMAFALPLAAIVKRQGMLSLEADKK